MSLHKQNIIPLYYTFSFQIMTNHTKFKSVNTLDLFKLEKNISTSCPEMSSISFFLLAQISIWTDTQKPFS